MQKDIKIFIKKLSLFIIPILIWIGIVLIVDPFNYFNFSNQISKESKIESAKKLNSLLFNTLEFKNNPKNNIIIGDSRVRKLPVNKIYEITGKNYFTLYANAAKFNEIIDLFWQASSCTNLDNVILGINFNLYNEYAYSNRVSEINQLIENPLMYVFNQDILETVFLSCKNEFFGIKKQTKRNGKKFWSYTLNTTAKNQYSKWKKPKYILERLQEINKYCKKNNIKLTFLIVPNHRDFHKKLVYYGLEDEEKDFKREMKNLGTVIDYDFQNLITTCDECFGDPLHTNDSISTLIVNEIFNDNYEIGRKSINK